MQDRPGSLELLSAVQQMLREIALPQLEGAAAYQLRIAINALGIVARAIDQCEPAAEQELARLRHLLRREDGDLLALNEALAHQLRDGTLDPDDPAVREHLWRTTLAKLAIDQPGYPRYVAITQKSPDRG